MTSKSPDTAKPQTVKSWEKTLRDAFAKGTPHPLELAEQALQEYPYEASILNLAALAALLEEKPERCLRHEKRLRKYYQPDQRDHLLEALALGQQGYRPRAQALLKKHRLNNVFQARRWFVGGPGLDRWLQSQWLRIWTPASKPQNAARAAAKSKKLQAKLIAASAAAAETPAAPATAPDTPSYPELERVEPEIPVRYTLTNADTVQLQGQPERETERWFNLRAEFAQLGLFQGFDELLCLPLLHDVQTYWYQQESVRKVLKVFRGRVLLADEVGLGKTIEAGMVLKEYLLRGMVERFLILTPAALVGQWQEELATKFDIVCASSYDSLLRRDADAFWAQPQVIASIAAARLQQHFKRLTAQHYDLVIVDEAHHLKNRSSRSYKLVDALQKRFLLLLSATPVQNSLLELYNLLTLLKPGVVKTQQAFRAQYMTPGKPRTPVNRDHLRELMRDVMIRNTRALVDVRLPPRHATTLRLEAPGEERDCYQALDALIRETHAEGAGKQRLALHHLLSAAGSSPAAAAGALARFAQKHGDQRWRALQARYANLDCGVKEQALVDLLRRNPDEKKMVFVHHLASLDHLDTLLQQQGFAFVRFDGSLSGPEKDAAIERFRAEIPVLLSTESGGEGRNVQFCNTLVNFDLPWNPMAIEQRIGRIHRIGQTREVFVFNLVAAGTLESHVLQILDEKINMFELVVGEIDAILGELDEERDFAELIFDAWVATTLDTRTQTFVDLGERMAQAKGRYEAVKQLDEALFGEDFETA